MKPVVLVSIFTTHKTVSPEVRRPDVAGDENALVRCEKAKATMDDFMVDVDGNVYQTFDASQEAEVNQPGDVVERICFFCSKSILSADETCQVVGHGASLHLHQQCTPAFAKAIERLAVVSASERMVAEVQYSAATEEKPIDDH